jgi:hypothetical protein
VDGYTSEELAPKEDARPFSVRSHLWIAAKVSPRPINLYVTVNSLKGGLMDVVSRLYHFNS